MSTIVETAPGKIVWDATTAPELVAAVPGLLLHLGKLRTAIPVAQSLFPFDADGFTRPYRHLRAVYRRIPGGIIAIKGSEPLASSPESSFEMMGQFRIDYPARGRSLFSALEHFPLVEQKIPLAVTVAEALEDAEAAAMVQRAHLARFGELARVPLPLLVVRWPDSAVERHLALLMPRLSPRARKIVAQQAADGLGAFVYYYPSLPLRVGHLPEILKVPGNSSDWQVKLSALADPNATIERWIDLVARLLVLGFLPGSIDSIGIGHCLETKNAVIDGGFVDLGSVLPMAEAATAQQFAETLLAAISDLAKTVRYFLLGDAIDVEAEYRNPSLTMLLVLHRLLPALGERVRALGPTDPRLAAFFAPASTFDGLVEGFAALYPKGPAGGHS